MTVTGEVSPDPAIERGPPLLPIALTLTRASHSSTGSSAKGYQTAATCLAELGTRAAAKRDAVIEG